MTQSCWSAVKQQFIHSFKEWTGQSLSSLLRITDDISQWRTTITDEASVGVPPTTPGCHGNELLYGTESLDSMGLGLLPVIIIIITEFSAPNTTAITRDNECMKIKRINLNRTKKTNDDSYLHINQPIVNRVNWATKAAHHQNAVTSLTSTESSKQQKTTTTTSCAIKLTKHSEFVSSSGIKYGNAHIAYISLSVSARPSNYCSCPWLSWNKNVCVCGWPGEMIRDPRELEKKRYV